MSAPLYVRVFRPSGPPGILCPMTRTQTIALLLLCCASTGAAQSPPANRLTDAERRAGWRFLFDGATLHGWRGLGYDTVPTSHWKVSNGTIHLLSSGAVPRM